MKFKFPKIGAVALACFGLLMTNVAKADSSVEGQYQGRNIVVQSPQSDDGFGFCITRVSVNGEAVSVDVNSSAFQINFDEFDLDVGDPVMIVFEHDEGCKPKLLNPEVLLPKSTFQLQSISCTPEGALSWSTTEESGKLTYYVEQYRWNKWVVIGEVDGAGTPELNNYLFYTVPHSGENKVRVSQVDNTGNKKPSKEVVFEADILEPELNAINKQKIIEFVAGGKRVKTKYEIFDAYGNIVKKGYNSIVDYSNLKSGVYHVNYDNKTDRIIVK
ncbi:MAG: hypothetical protein MK078_00820 [Crocinitomicaceae bacterium]|nr:hypothetical protein [Crocinitomicaceae bacterium]